MCWRQPITHAPRRVPVTLAALADTPFCFTNASFTLNDRLWQVCRQAGFTSAKADAVAGFSGHAGNAGQGVVLLPRGGAWTGTPRFGSPGAERGNGNLETWLYLATPRLSCHAQRTRQRARYKEKCASQSQT